MIICVNMFGFRIHHTSCAHLLFAFARKIANMRKKLTAHVVMQTNIKQTHAHIRGMNVVGEKKI